MERKFKTTAGGKAVAREQWSVKRMDGRDVLSAHGQILDGAPRHWDLSATVAREGLLESMELQITSDTPPPEVTTVALRSHGDRIFMTRIPPGGVPDRLETAFPSGSLVVGPSLALLALLAGRSEGQPGMGKRALFVRVSGEDLSLRLEDGIVLHGRRVRGPGADGREGWVRPVELRRAADAGREGASLHFDSGGNLLRARWPQSLPAREATPDVGPD